MSIYVTSDLHWGHNKEFIWKARGYSSVEDMNEAQIIKFNDLNLSTYFYFLSQYVCDNLYKELNLDYPLKDVPPLSISEVDLAKKVILEGINEVR